MNVPLRPKTRKKSPFYWWRRYPTPKYNSRQPILTRIKAGEFDPSPFIEQSLWELEWMKQDIEEETKDYINPNSAAFFDEVYNPIKTRYMKRFKKLTIDSWDDEDKRLKAFAKALKLEFSLSYEFVWDFLSDFDGSALEAYNSLLKFSEKHIGVVARRLYLKNTLSNIW